MAKPASKATTGPAASRGAHRAPMAKAPVVKTATLEQTTRSISPSSSFLSAPGGTSGGVGRTGIGCSPRRTSLERRRAFATEHPRADGGELRATLSTAFAFTRTRRVRSSAESVGAEAVTVGEQIAFAPAAFRPETASGEHPIACMSSRTWRRERRAQRKLVGGIRSRGEPAELLPTYMSQRCHAVRTFACRRDRSESAEWRKRPRWESCRHARA